MEKHMLLEMHKGGQRAQRITSLTSSRHRKQINVINNKHIGTKFKLITRAPISGSEADCILPE